MTGAPPAGRDSATIRPAMPLQPGHNLRHYEIVEPIGAGGMGEVYRARDTNLDRDVAIKVLPREYADTPLHLARLEREAKAIAALSHPNILAVHDFGTEGGIAFVVTELLQGETLRERLSQSGAVAPRKAAELGRQIARGLAAAHDKGIVHRDLKPENLFLTEEGQVKILDFGLAAESGAESGPAPADDTRGDATRTSLTAPGTVLGTVDYMSPEQVRGQPVDHRSDIFSFGSVLHEMVGGARPFRRDTQAETMTAVLREEPSELTSLGDGIPPALATIVRRCLEKRPGERFQSALDLAFSLEALSDSAISTATAAAITGVPEPRRRLPIGALALLLLIGLTIGVAATWLLRPVPTPTEPAGFNILSSRRGTVTNARFAGPEGAVIYSASWEGDPLRLYPAMSGVPTSDPLKLESADLLSIAPSGELALALDRRYPIGWEAIGTLAVAQPGGSAPRQLLEDVLVADWAPDGELAVAHEVDGVVRLEYPIGKVLYESTGWISDLRVHPDGQRILIADNRARGDNAAVLKIVDREGGVETVGPGGSWGALWAPDGETIWFGTGSAVFSLSPGGERRRILETPTALRLLDSNESGQVLSAVALSRREMIGRAPGATSDVDLSWLDWSTPRVLSSDGRQVVFEEGNDVAEDGYGIYLRDTRGGAPLRLGYGVAVAMSPDARWVAVVEGAFGDDSRLVLVPTGPGEPVTIATGDLLPLSEIGIWLHGDGPDDRGTLVFVGRDRSGSTGLYSLPLTGEAAPRAITPPDFALSPLGHAVSPDGKRVIVNPATGPAVEFGFDGTGPRPVAGLEPEDVPLRFDQSGRYLFAAVASTVPARIMRIELATGVRSTWRELSPIDPSGVVTVDRVRISADGTAYVYSIRRMTSNVALITGMN